MAIVETEIEGQRVYIDTETGQRTQAPVNTYGGRVTYRPVQQEGLEGSVVTRNVVDTIDGYPASAYKVEPDGRGGLRTFNPQTGQYEQGASRVGMDFGDAGLPVLPPSIGSDFGGSFVSQNAGANNKGGFFEDFVLPAVIGGIATAGVGSMLGAGSLFGGGANALTEADALTSALTEGYNSGTAIGASGAGTQFAGAIPAAEAGAATAMDAGAFLAGETSGAGGLSNLLSGGAGVDMAGNVFNAAGDLVSNQAGIADYIKGAIQSGNISELTRLLPNIPGGSQILKSLLGGSGGTPTSGAIRPSGGLSGQTNIIAPSNAMLSFAPAPKSGSFVNQQSDNTSTLFSGLTPEQSSIQVPNAPMSNAAPLQTAEFSDYAPIQKTVPIPVAHGGLMNFKIGGNVPDEAAETPATEYVGSVKQVADTNKRIAEILAQKGAKAASSDDQIREYLRRSQDSNARLDFLSPLSARMMRGRPSRPEAMYSGLQQSSVTGAAPAMGYSARPVQPLQQSPSIVNMARIPFAAHGGAIHPHLASVLADRNFEINKEMIPGPEGRYYAKHEQRGFAVGGPGTGQSDDIPTMLSDGEYVIDADTVAALGDGSSKAGASVLDKFRQQIRQHKRSASTNDIPPKAKSPMEYMKMARKGK